MLRRKRDILIILFLLFIFSAGVRASETPVAKVGELSYFTLAAALEAAEDYAAVRLLTDAVWDENAAAAAKATGLKIESFDVRQPKNLICATDISLRGAMTFLHLALCFAPGVNIYARGHSLVIEETVAMAGPNYPLLYGGGSGGTLYGANLSIAGGTYAGILGGGAGPPKAATGRTFIWRSAKTPPWPRAAASSPAMPPQTTRPPPGSS